MPNPPMTSPLTAEEAIERAKRVLRDGQGSTRRHGFCNADLHTILADRERLEARAQAAEARIAALEEEKLRLRKAAIQARGALRLDAMVSDEGQLFGTTTAALEALDYALCIDEGCPHSATPHVCVNKDAAALAARDGGGG